MRTEIGIDVTGAVLATRSVVPVYSSPSPCSDQVNQLVLGEGALINERIGDLALVQSELDDCVGWVHLGFLMEVSQGEMTSWLSASAWSSGASLNVLGSSLVLPHRARVRSEGSSRVRLPDGRSAQIERGTVSGYGQLMAESLEHSAADWAWQEFGEAPFLRGGVTTAGIDSGALVQTTYLVRGIRLPREPRGQVTVGTGIEFEDTEAGDLLFFRGEEGEAITHVALAADRSTIVHSTVSMGGVVREPFTPEARAGDLIERLVAVRRVQ